MTIRRIFPGPWGFGPSKRAEAAAYAKYILQEKPNARIAVLYSSDPSGEEWRLGLHDGLGDRAAALIIKELSFAYADPAGLDAQVEAAKSSGADVFMNLTVGKFATRAVSKAYDIGWRPLQFIPNASLSISAFLEPAGLEKAKGIVSNARSKGWLTPQAQRDPAVREFLDWMKKYLQDANPKDANNVYGYEVAQTLVELLKKCGDNLTRANVMNEASHLNLELGMLRPGIRITTSPSDYRPIKELFLVQFDGKDWTRFGDVSVSVSGD
jgi:branched-chain amino acid transport system substrate-binding protein